MIVAGKRLVRRDWQPFTSFFAWEFDSHDHCILRIDELGLGRVRFENHRWHGMFALHNPFADLMLAGYIEVEIGFGDEEIPTEFIVFDYKRRDQVLATGTFADSA